MIDRIDEIVRVMVQSKSNLAPIGSPLAFELNPVTGFNWRSDYSFETDEMLCDRKQKAEKQSDRAQRLLRSSLAVETVAMVDIEQRAKEWGVSMETIRRAKDFLGVRSIKQGSRWYWELPVDIHDGQDCQPSDVTNMTTLTIFQSEEEQDGEYEY